MSGEGENPASAGIPDLGDAWLVVIDPQRIFASPEESEWGSPMFAGIVEPVQRLAEAVGPERTVVTRWVPSEKRPGSWSDYFDAWPFADRPATDHIFDLVSDLRGRTAHPSVDRSTFGKWCPELEGVCGATPTLIVTGVSTDCCVISTVLPAADAGARVVVVTDACAGSTQDNHDAAVTVLGLYPPQVALASSTEVLDALR